MMWFLLVTGNLLLRMRKSSEWRKDRILITDDKDFGELVFRSGEPKGVILLRTSTTDPVRRFQLIEKILKSADVREKFVVIRDDAVKLRKIKF